MKERREYGLRDCEIGVRLRPVLLCEAALLLCRRLRFGLPFLDGAHEGQELRRAKLDQYTQETMLVSAGMKTHTVGLAELHRGDQGRQASAVS